MKSVRGVLAALMLCALLGCSSAYPPKNLSADKWFPLKRGLTWRIVHRYRQISLRVVDSASSNGRTRAILRFDGRQNDLVFYDLESPKLPVPMNVEATRDALSLGFLLSQEGYNHMQLRPPLPILRSPVLEGDAWEWRGNVTFVNPKNRSGSVVTTGTAVIVNTARPLDEGLQRTDTEWLRRNHYRHLDSQCMRADVDLTVHGSLSNRYRIWLCPGKGILRYEVRNAEYPQNRMELLLEPRF